MMFAKRLREGVRRGEITCSVRIWMRPHVRVGARYRMDEGEVEVDSIESIGLLDITPWLARESGFLGVLDLLKVAKHGSPLPLRPAAKQATSPAKNPNPDALEPALNRISGASGLL
jgi:hypothetical protein